MADIALGSVGKIIDIGLKIKEAVETVKHNEKECRDTEKCVARVTDIISDFNEAIKRYDEVSPVIQTIKANNKSLHAALEDLAESLQGALQLVTKCQEKHVVRRFIGAGDMAKELQLMQDSILRKLTIGSFATIVAQLGITLMAIAQQSARPQNRSKKDETKISTGSGAPTDHLSGLRNFALTELEFATHNFSMENLIGRGTFAHVFKGILRNGQVVAVKNMRFSDVEDASLHNELMIGVKLRHRNVVKTLGYCIDDKVVSVWHEGQQVEAIKPSRILVLGYLPNGSLHNLAWGEQRIYWPFYFRILQGIAQGLNYLHEQNILHLDIKPHNIIFDSDMNPVIIDFGFSVVLDNEVDIITTDRAVGTLGFLAPEYIKTSVVSKKQDVFAFGVILLKTIFRGCAKVEFQNFYPSYEDGTYNVILQQDVIKEVFDSTLVEESEVLDVVKCLKVGFLCIEMDPADRPTMAEVLDMLNGEKEVPAKTTNIYP